MIQFIFVIIAVIFSMFLLFTLSKNDFVLLRKNVSLHELFDVVIISMAVGLLFARVFFIIDMQEWSWFHPFRFFHLIKIPGLSLYGFFVGVVFPLFWLLRKKKVLHRVYDILFISILPLFIMSLATRTYSLGIPSVFIQIALAVIGICIISILITFFHNYTLRDGSLALIIFLLVSVDLFLNGFLSEYPTLLFSLSLSQISAVIFFAISAILLIHNQGIVRFRKK